MLHHMPTRLLEMAGAGLGVNRLVDKVAKLAVRLHGVTDVDDLYNNLVSEWPAQSLVRSSNRLPTALDPADWVDRLEPMEARMMAWDTLTYLPDDILHKVDRAAMAVSLETRVPFLDHRVAELAWRLPLTMKIHHGQGKWALRQILHKYVPRELVERPKSGFALPIGSWLRGPLRSWAEELLSKERLEREGWLDAASVRTRWQEHCNGTRDWAVSLWSVLMFQAWLRADVRP